MRTRTETRSHYEVQRDRRKAQAEGWRAYRQTVIRAGDVERRPHGPGVTAGHYIGAAAGRPTKLVDCTEYRLEPGAAGTAIRESWDTIYLVVSGTGWTEVDGRRIPWRPWDAIHVPHWAAYRHGTDDPRGAVLLSCGSRPVFESLGSAWTLPADRPDPTEASGGRRGRLHTDYDAIELRPNPKGTRSKFLVDLSIGSVTSGLTMVMIQLGPGLFQAKHRHPGEALLYVVEGRGHSYFGEQATGGREETWEAGDLLVVDHFIWHQHFNDDPERPARLVRMHLMETMLTTMQALLDPLVLLEEPPEELAKAPDATIPDWPEDVRPD
ncbi:MAG: cupin domain-containing protein [Streptosporangiales bacterium]|nr:cupin domain-containing protein [Streptosporangiales bacterium]